MKDIPDFPRHWSSETWAQWFNFIRTYDYAPEEVIAWIEALIERGEHLNTQKEDK